MSPTWTRSDNEVLATLQDVVALESVNPGLPGGQRGESAMVDYLETFFAGLDIPTQQQQVLPGRANILATLEGKDPDRVLLFECHMDTASAEVMTIPPFEPHIRDGLLYGRGSCDTKAGGVAMIHAMKALRRAGTQPACTVVYAGVVDEEHLFRGSRHLAENLQPAAAVISEPTDLEVVRAHKGVVRFRIAVEGQAAHSAKPHLGVNAITAMARLVNRIEETLGPAYAVQNDPLLGQPTFNIGVIEGGAQVNFVPDSCHITIDCRLLPGTTPEATMDQFRRIVEQARAADPNLKATVENAYFTCAPLGTTAEAAIVQQAAVASHRVLGRAEITGVPYATDGSPFSERGVPAIVLGPGSIDQAHGAVEWVDCQQVLQAVDIYRYIMEEGV
ncbi:MAG: ArgE/DapE family deacylase [Candidatus Latescibacteria bacterium]|nr:ArgE/DapE family deacylase [Candidatus Latescibacterota bacterium]